MPEDATPTTSTGFVITLSVTSYTKPFNVNGWLADTSPYSQIGLISPISVAGIQSYRITFVAELGEGEPKIIVPRGNTVFTASYASSFSTDSPQEQSALHILDLVLQSIQFTP